MVKRFSERPYRGRFAPSPSGPLHFGSLYTALASYLDAQANQGTWLVRIEDLDPPREKPGASQEILNTLERFGLHWQEPVIYQSQQSPHYDDAIELLKSKGKLFYCTCSRKQLAQHQHIYPGTCRATLCSPQAPHAIRFKVPEATITFDDLLMGTIRQHLPTEVGDFPIKRKDLLYAYQLAVVVDDWQQGITHVVRGSDLLDNTPRQIALQDALGYVQPSYLHLPIITNQQGQKLSKQTFANAIHHQAPTQVLLQLLNCLGQNPPPEIGLGCVDEILEWAIVHWDRQKLPTQPMPSPP